MQPKNEIHSSNGDIIRVETSDFDPVNRVIGITMERIIEGQVRGKIERTYLIAGNTINPLDLAKSNAFGPFETAIKEDLNQVMGSVIREALINSLAEHRIIVDHSIRRPQSDKKLPN